MKNKKRLLIIILAIIIVILVILLTVLIFGSIKSNKITEFENTVEKAACAYANDENFTKEICLGYENLCKVKYNTLITRDYLSADLVNPTNKQKISDDLTSYIQISWKDDEMVCTYKEG